MDSEFIFKESFGIWENIVLQETGQQLFVDQSPVIQYMYIGFIGC